MMPFELLPDDACHGWGVEHARDLINRVRIAVTQHEHNRRHVLDVEVHADVQRLSALDRFERAVQRAAELWVNAARGEVDELAVKVGCEKVGRVGVAQVVDVAVWKVRGVLHRPRPVKLVPRPSQFHPPLVDEPEPLRRRGDCNRIAGNAALVRDRLLPVAGNDLVPDVAGLVDWQSVQLVKDGMCHLVSNDPVWVVHRAEEEALLAKVDRGRLAIEPERSTLLLKQRREPLIGDVFHKSIRRQVIGHVTGREIAQEPHCPGNGRCALAGIVMYRAVSGYIVIIPGDMDVPIPLLDLFLFYAYYFGIGYGCRT